MKRYFLLLFIVSAFQTTKLFAQPFADIVSFNYQTFSSTDKVVSQRKNKTDDYVLNLFLPKQFKNGNTLMIRINTESMNSTASPDSSYSSRLSAISLPIGVKLLTKNKKWETILIGIPKIASDFKGKIDSHAMQYGGIFLQQLVVNDKLKFKLGLYYNREAFGNFFMPLVGVDWKATSRISLYGIIPTNYKLEFKIKKDKLYAGFNFKALTRSFSLSKQDNYDYVRYNEEQIKVFVDYFVYKKLLVFAEAGYTLGKNPINYFYNTKTINYSNPVYAPLKSYPIFNIGVAYRIRFDLDKKE